MSNQETPIVIRPAPPDSQKMPLPQRYPSSQLLYKVAHIVDLERGLFSSSWEQGCRKLYYQIGLKTQALQGSPGIFCWANFEVAYKHARCSLFLVETPVSILLVRPWLLLSEELSDATDYLTRVSAEVRNTARLAPVVEVIHDYLL